MPYEEFAKKAELGEVVGQLTVRGLTLHLPSQLPKGFKLTAIWGKFPDGRIAFPVIAVYSNSGDVNITSGELVVEVFRWLRSHTG